MKVAITLVKYIPQVYHNYQRKTTEGWSLENVLLDLTGGSLTFLQIFIDWIDTGESKQFSSGLNVAKFLLGLLSIIFDLIFLFQHYVLYNPKHRAYELRDDAKDETVDEDNECKYKFLFLLDNDV